MDDRAAKTETSQVPRGGWAWFLTFVILLGLSFGRINGVTEVRAARLPVVVADPSMLHLGERWEGETYCWPISLHNRTDRPVYVAAFRTSCGCVSVEPSQVQIAAGATVTMAATIHATANRRQSMGDFQQVSVTGEDGGGQPLLVAHLRSRVRPSCEADPPVGVFAGPVVRGAESAPLRLRIKPQVAASALRVEADPEVPTELLHTEAGFDILVGAKPRQAGAWTRSLRITLTDSAGHVAGVRTIPVSAEVVEPVFAEPSDFNFGAVRTGTTAHLTVRLVSANSQAFQIESWTGTPGVRTAALPDGSRYDVSFPVGKGDCTFREFVELAAS